MDAGMFASLCKELHSHSTITEGAKYVGFTKQQFLWMGLVVFKGKNSLLLKQNNGALLYLTKGEDYDNTEVFVTLQGRAGLFVSKPLNQSRSKLLEGAAGMLDSFQLKQVDIDRGNFQASAYFKKCPHGWTHTFYQSRQKDNIPKTTTNDQTRYLLPDQTRHDNKQILLLISLLRQANGLCERCS